MRKVLHYRADFVPAQLRIPNQNPLLNEYRFGWNSSNWAGYARYSTTPAPGSSTNKPFVSVHGEWTVPAISLASTNKNAMAWEWIGIDGADVFFGHPRSMWVIQIGTGADYNGPGNSAQYYLWWQVVTPSTFTTSLPTFPDPRTFPVSPGDYVLADIGHTSTADLYRLTLTNTTKGWTFTQTVIYYGPGVSVEFIMERPAFGGFVPLANFGQITFSNCRINSFLPEFTTDDRGYMVLPPDLVTRIATPSIPNDNKDSFRVAFGDAIPAPPNRTGPVRPTVPPIRIRRVPLTTPGPLLLSPLRPLSPQRGNTGKRGVSQNRTRSRTVAKQKAGNVKSKDQTVPSKKRQKPSKNR